MREAANAIDEFNRVLSDSIMRAARDLAPEGRTVDRIVTEGPPLTGDGFARNEVKVTIVLDNGDRLVGHGGGVLEALAEIERRQGHEV